MRSGNARAPGAAPDGTAGGFALRDVSLEVRRGEALVVLGPPGAGKQALFHLIAGTARRPERGQVLLHGQDAAGVPPHRRGIGVVPGEGGGRGSSLLPHLSVAGNVAFPLRARGFGRRERERRTLQALDLLCLRALAGLRPSQLDLAQRQLVALARAAAIGPELLLLHEPFAGVDAEARPALHAWLRRVREALGATVVHLTRDRDEAFALGDRIALLEGGVLLQLADAQHLYERPQSPLAARLTGEVNELHGTVQASSGAGEEVQVKLDGIEGLAAAMPAGSLEAGQRCRLCVRPERLAVAAADLGEGALPARVIEASYRGDHLRLLLEAGGVRLLARRPAALGAAGLNAGSQVSVAWPAGHALAFPAG